MTSFHYDMLLYVLMIFIKTIYFIFFCLFSILITVSKITRKITHVSFFNSMFYCLQSYLQESNISHIARTYRQSEMKKKTKQNKTKTKTKTKTKHLAHHAHPNIPLHTHIARCKNMIFIYDSVRSSLLYLHRRFPFQVELDHLQLSVKVQFLSEKQQI